MGIIDFQNASFSYDGVRKALDGITLSIESGSFTCVLGGNGSGKSTLARHIDALLVPDVGEVRVLGLSSSDRDNLYEIRSHAGLVFQNPTDQIVAAIVQDDVAFGPENLGVPSEQLVERVRDALERVGLQGFEERETSALSGGQKQRVAIAGALAMEPPILVLDEASAMLDPRGRQGLMKLCRALNDAGITIVMITHFMDQAVQADRVVVLDRGRIALEGSPSEVLVEARRLSGLALEVPFPVKLCLALEDAGVPVAVTIREDELERQLRGLPAVQRLAADGVQGDSREGCTALPKGEPLITLEDVSFSYAPKRTRKQGASRSQSEPTWGDDGRSLWALEDVSFALNEGDFLGIAGHTGSGKSTLIQLMSGILAPTQGSVMVRGQAMAKAKHDDRIRRAVGLVFQYPEHQLFAATVFEDVAFGPRNLGLSAEEVRQRVNHALELVRLDPEDIADRNPFEISGGQQRRVALAGVLAMEPQVLILDEPTAGLDPRSHDLFLELISELHRSSNLVTVMVSHNMNDLADLCDRVLLLNRGTVVADGSPLAVLTEEEPLRSIGLGVPDTVRMAQSLGIMGAFDRIPTIPQLADAIKGATDSGGGDG